MKANNRSVLRAVSILKSFHSGDTWVSATDISRRAELPFASTHRLLQALGQAGVVERGNGGAYRLGFLIASLARKVDIDDCLYRASLDLMNDLSLKFNVSIFAGRLEGNMVTFIGNVLSANWKRKFGTRVSQMSAGSLSLGRVLMADLDECALDEILDDYAFVPLTPNAITSKSRLVSELALVRKNGFAVEREETWRGFGSVAVPIHDNEGRVIAAMAASEEAGNLTPERVATLRAEMMNFMPVIRRRIYPESSTRNRRAVAGGEVARITCLAGK